MDHLHLDFETKFTIDDDGAVEGIAWPYGSADKAGDIIKKGAVRLSVSELPMLRGHDPDALIGTWTEIKETDEGLVVRGNLDMKSRMARGTRSQILTKQYTGLSIGFLRSTVKSARRAKGRIISELDLVEVSIVRDPSHPGARVTGAKSFNTAIAIAEAINRATAALSIGTTK